MWNIQICKMLIYIGILKHWQLSWFRYETFIDFLSLVFRYEERETQLLLCWPFHLTQQTPGVSRRPQTGLASSNFKSQRASVSFGSQLTAFFSKSPRILAHRFRAWRHSNPRPISYLEVLSWHLWLSHPPRASVNTCAQCVPLPVH